MHLSRTRRLQRFASWIASFAILMAAWAPAVSQAMVAAGLGGADWVEVCTSQGMRWVSVDQTSDESQEVLAGACAYCFTHCASFGLTPHGHDGFAGGVRFFETPSPALDAPPIAGSPRSAHLTRGPPLSV